jgi:hypothetical protein
LISHKEHKEIQSQKNWSAWRDNVNGKLLEIAFLSPFVFSVFFVAKSSVCGVSVANLASAFA